MTVLRRIRGVAAGILLANAVPHGVNGVSGRRFPTPFASPPGVGLSSPTLNIVWSALNAAGGVALLPRRARTTGDTVAVGLGAVSMAFFLARYFGSLGLDQRDEEAPLSE